jgi:non-heme Fe2+,alpha-ketoglutarate-dependent halogenase
MPSPRPSLSEEQINSYRSNGYLFPFDALSAEEVSQYRRGLAEMEDHLGGTLMSVEAKYRHNSHLLCKWMDDLVRHPAILDVVEGLLGPDLILYTSRFFIKEPKSEGFAAWHQDSAYFGLQPHDHVTAWVALSDVSMESGPIEFAKGSHIRGQLSQKSKMVEGSVNTAGQIIVDWFDQSQTEFGVLKPGQFSLHHTCVVHQPAPNRSDTPRIGVTLSYIPTRPRNTGSVRMPVSFVRGQDTHGTFDLQARPETDFGEAETRCHDTSSELYLKNFYEQLELHEA